MPHPSRRPVPLLTPLVALVVTGLVAVVVVFVGRELGLDEQAAAVPEAGVTTSAEAAAVEAAGEQQSEVEPALASTDLTLTLTAEAVCETKRGRSFSGSVPALDEDDNEVGRKDVFTGWALVAETPVRWSVSGGTGPYHLEIDNETRDGSGAYEGPSGTASVSCAPNPGEVFYKDYDQERRYRADPQIDSGPKTIRATVTDATGATAEASVVIYVILRVEYSPFILGSGKTYSIEGILITVPQGLPEGVEVLYAGSIALDCVRGSNCEDPHLIFLHDMGYRGELYIGSQTGKVLGSRVLIGSIYGPQGVVSGTASAAAAASVNEAEVQVNLDALSESVGKPPSGRE